MPGKKVGDGKMVGVRMPGEMLARIERLVPKLAKTDLAAAGEVTTSVVIRLALMRGLSALEKECGR